MRRFVAVVVLFALFGFLGGAAWGGGGQSYPLGAEAFMVGMAPPPGFTFVNYLNYYSAGTMNAPDGHENPLFDDVSSVAEVMRVIWISKTQLLGADYGQHFFLPIVSADLNWKVPLGPQKRSSYSDTNVPYFIYAPFFLAWHAMGGKLHVVADPMDIYIPLYNEDKGNLASIGRNFWTFEPVLAVTWLPTQNLEFSAKLMYDFNTQQGDYALPTGHLADRTPGQEFHFDYNVSYALNSAFRIGINGYFYQQVTDDDYDVEHFDDATQALLRAFEGQRSRVWAIGPGAWYQWGKLFTTFRVQFETAAENKTEGYNLWLNLSYVF